MFFHTSIRRNVLFICLIFLTLIQHGCTEIESPFVVRQKSTPLTYSLPPRSVSLVKPWDNYQVNSICLINDSVFPGMNSYDLEKFIKDILTSIGINIITSENTCDAVMNINVRGKALSRNYVPGGRLFTGADIEGTISLTTQGKSDIELKLDIHEPPPAAATWFNDNPPTSPTDIDFEDYWKEPVTEYLIDIWGPRINIWLDSMTCLSNEEVCYEIEEEFGNPIINEDLIYALNYRGTCQARCACMSILNYFKETQNIEELNQFIPALIHGLQVEKGSFDECAIDVLQTISGETEIGDDPDSWIAWWQVEQPSQEEIPSVRNGGVISEILIGLGALAALYGVFLIISGKLIFLKNQFSKGQARIIGCFLVFPTIFLILVSTILEIVFASYIQIGLYLFTAVIIMVYINSIRKKMDGIK